ncbi:methylthioribulose 1-phosphate dehydratase [Sodalis ligni]|jgi:methylthioribulose-1-phosphate dehydratase|uniref:Methylthioribulose-1-phosphate dehydratase n=1 Tax=Sodalis ligni TaxID=2697027 RepID=A0A4R1ND40_9GAMM|nr:methylthioribulose 1-phosphate dehydratase [Sodalis ligni]TCL04699.1 methylthioribulose-1-phosphate dehydratase [Sodalis ligni]
MIVTQQLAELVAACHWIGAKGWCPATGGNMSVRLDGQTCLISESGQDKGCLEAEHFLRVDILSQRVDDHRRPSAETALHTLIYRRDPLVGAILHTHSVNATVLSLAQAGDSLVLNGYEMQKSLAGVHSHLTPVTVAIFDNDQDIAALAERVAARDKLEGLRHGFLVRGHGLYCWGRDVKEARRHLEGLEFLFQCALQRRLLEAK